MATSNSRRVARDRIVKSIVRELMGPSDPKETISEFPTTRYIVGRLAPAQQEVDPRENDTFGAGSDDDEAGGSEATTPLIIGFSPSSIGISFILGKDTKELKVALTWGDYKREKAEDGGGAIWQRYPREAIVTGVRVDKVGPIAQTPLSQSSAPPGVTIQNVDDPDITLEGVVHDVGGDKAVSLFMVNRRAKAPLNSRAQDERWVMQPMIKVMGPVGELIFKAKGHTGAAGMQGDDPEMAIANLLYRHAKEFATGHGVAAGWSISPEVGDATDCVYTDYIPSFEVPNLIAPGDKAGRANLDMYELSLAKSGDDLANYLKPMVDAYEVWITDREAEARSADIASSPQMADAAKVSIEACKNSATRMRAGLDLIKSDPIVLEAFKFANYVMWDQRIHSIWAAENSKSGEIVGAAEAFDKHSNRTWRPFQMGFILQSLKGVIDGKSEDRRLVDLLWFPTGGGKTEAYLGLAAFILAFRRLHGDREGMVSVAGVSIIMRYTLRLLTVQQFQRAAALIAACELARRADPGKWGEEPFRIGLWVGRGTTPNSSIDSRNALENLKDGKKPKEGSPVQLVYCPRCGKPLVTEKGAPEGQTYEFESKSLRTIVCCRNHKCEFCSRKSSGEGLPVVVVDDEIYRTCPSLLIATVDKFARMPFKGETQSLFGIRNRYSPTYGHLTQAHGGKVGGRIIRDATPAPRLLPPDLIIQDELHLISGPLGTMVGLYETAIDSLTRLRPGQGAIEKCKIIASTATIRRAAYQARQLYNRELTIFPPNGLSAKDSFFAREVDIDPESDESAGRLYIGMDAPGSSDKTLLVRVYSALLAAAQAEIDTDASSADPYGTLVGYFNSLRALGGAKRLVEDDIKNVRLKYLNKQRGFPKRLINDPEELTSRLESWKIPGLLKKLNNTFPRGKTDWPVDVLLATNMISVGVDIDRLGLMVVSGQPRSTSEYIQATSRVGRKFPGLVVTMYNWLGARDLSHFERFRSYHAAFYRHVEAISVTPFSSRALDRALRGLFAAMSRLEGPSMAQEAEAQKFDPAQATTAEIIDDICERAEKLVGKNNADLVRARLLSHRDDWATLADDLLRYSWLKEGERPPENSRVLLKTAGTNNEGEWPTPGSLREVEPTAAFYLSEEI